MPGNTAAEGGGRDEQRVALQPLVGITLALPRGALVGELDALGEHYLDLGHRERERAAGGELRGARRDPLLGDLALARLPQLLVDGELVEVAVGGLVKIA